MAINDLINEFIVKAVELYKYTESKNMVGNKKYDAKHSIKLGKNVDKIVKKLIVTNDGKEEFLKLLTHQDILIRYLAAEYLYPILPNTCLIIMKNFYNTLTDKIDKFTISTKIEGLTQKQPFFISCYKKLYNVEDLESLNREK